MNRLLHFIRLATVLVPAVVAHYFSQGASPPAPSFLGISIGFNAFYNAVFVVKYAGLRRSNPFDNKNFGHYVYIGDRTSGITELIYIPITLSIVMSKMKNLKNSFILGLAPGLHGISVLDLMLLKFCGRQAIGRPIDRGKVTEKYYNR